MDMKKIRAVLRMLDGTDVTEFEYEDEALRLRVNRGAAAGIAPALVAAAMGARHGPRPEAALAGRVREVVGRDVFLVGTFGPHGNEDEAFLRHADMAFAVKYFPHYDSHLQGERAGRMLVRAIRGDYKPATATVRVPII